jgi:hypothetical protein
MKPSSDIILFEIFTPTPIDQAFKGLKKILLGSNYTIISEKTHTYICVTQGSLRGILPLSAKKVVSFFLTSDRKGTKISSSSQISDDWKNLALYGSIITVALIGIFSWITIDMNSYIETARPNFWAWLVQIYGPQGSWGAIFLIELIQSLAIFLVFTILFEILIVIYVYPRKNAFSRQVLEKITKMEY